MAAKAKATWQGELKTGSGTFTAGDTLSADFSFKTRFEDQPGANPEQLIGAALAACFTMALSNQLAQGGSPVDKVETEASVQIRQIDGKPTIASVALTTVGHVPGADEATFLEQAQLAKDDCIISRALAGIPEITLDARLAD